MLDPRLPESRSSWGQLFIREKDRAGGGARTTGKVGSQSCQAHHTPAHLVSRTTTSPFGPFPGMSQLGLPSDGESGHRNQGTWVCSLTRPLTTGACTSLLPSIGVSVRGPQTTCLSLPNSMPNKGTLGA